MEVAGRLAQSLHSSLPGVRNMALSSLSGNFLFFGFINWSAKFLLKILNWHFSFSEQHLVDCEPYDYGCNGGWYTNAWYYLKNVALGSAKQSLYTYTATVHTRQLNIYISFLFNQRYSHVGYVRLNWPNSDKYLQVHLLHDRSKDFFIHWPCNAQRRQHAIGCADLRSHFGGHRRRQFFLLIRVRATIMSKVL